jgi:hypothetical protein
MNIFAVKTLQRYIDVLIIALLVSSPLYAENELKIIRRSSNVFDVQLTASDDIAGLQFCLQASSGVSLGDVQPGTLTGTSSSMMSFYKTNDSTANIFILNSQNKIFPRGSGTLVSINFTIEKTLSFFEAMVTHVMVINARGDSLGVATVNYIWNEATSPLFSGENITAFALGQNYPNPFNPATKLNYRLQKPGQVRLSIYDMRGREISRLVDQFQNEGMYEIQWSSKSETGYTMSSGIYIARLTVNNVSIARKMLLTK